MIRLLYADSSFSLDPAGPHRSTWIIGASGPFGVLDIQSVASGFDHNSIWLCERFSFQPGRARTKWKPGQSVCLCRFRQLIHATHELQYFPIAGIHLPQYDLECVAAGQFPAHKLGPRVDMVPVQLAHEYLGSGWRLDRHPRQRVDIASLSDRRAAELHLIGAPDPGAAQIR